MSHNVNDTGVNPMIKTLVAIEVDLASSMAIRYACQLGNLINMELYPVYVKEPPPEVPTTGVGWVRRTWEREIVAAGKEEILGPGEAEKVKGVPSAPQVVLRTALTRIGERLQRSFEVPRRESLSQAEIKALGDDMIAFDRNILDSMAARPLDPAREYVVYVECPEVMVAQAGFERAGLDETVRMHKLGKVKFVTFTPSAREKTAEMIAADNARLGDGSVVTFAMKAKDAPETAADEKIRRNSYTIYIALRPGAAYVPVRTCGMTALKIFDYLTLKKELEEKLQRKEELGPADNIAINQTIELIARGLGLLAGADSKDIIDLIANLDREGRLWLLDSGLILIEEIRPIDINEMSVINEMAHKVREAV
jgi:hypothetical protein